MAAVDLFDDDEPEGLPARHYICSDSDAGAVLDRVMNPQSKKVNDQRPNKVWNKMLGGQGESRRRRERSFV